MLGKFGGAPIADANDAALGNTPIACSSGVIFQPVNYHGRDYAFNTNALQARGLITLVNTIAERLIAAREALGMTQEAVAQAAGVSQGTIGNIESGARKNPRELLAIAAAVNVAPEWLKSGKGERNLGGAPRLPVVDPLVTALTTLSTTVADLEEMDRIAVGQYLDTLAKKPEKAAEITSRVQAIVKASAASRKRTGTHG